MVLSGFDDPGLGQKTGYNPGIIDAIAHLRYVEHSATALGFDGNIDLSAVGGTHPDIGAGETPPTVIGGEEYLTMDRITLVEGRLADPQRKDEAVMNAQAATEWGLHVGSVIAIPFYTDAESTSASYDGPPHLVAKVKLVGEVVFSSSVVEDDIDRLGSAVVLLSPALTAEVAPCCTYFSGSALQVAGGESIQRLVHEEAERVTPLAGGEVGGGGSTAATVVTKAQQAIKPEAVALGVFGGIAGLAVLLIVGLMIGRILRARSGGDVHAARPRGQSSDDAQRRIARPARRIGRRFSAGLRSSSGSVAPDAARPGSSGVPLQRIRLRLDRARVRARRPRPRPRLARRGHCQTGR